MGADHSSTQGTPDGENRIDRLHAPDTAWVTDITYIKTMEGFAYLAVVIDLFSRRVIGWSLQSRQTSEVVLQALHMAVWRRKPQNTVLVPTRAPSSPAWIGSASCGTTIWFTP